jgi:uncharacterized membrane protein YhaH (DUF805 family)
MEQNLPLEKEISGIFEKFPVFPDDVKEIIVKISPWLSLLLAILCGIGLLAVFGLGAAVSALGADSFGNIGVYYITMAIVVVQLYFYATAIKPLIDRQKKGWNNLYYVFLLSLVTGILGLINGGFIGLILTFLIGGWVLFQVKSKYS